MTVLTCWRRERVANWHANRPTPRLVTAAEELHCNSPVFGRGAREKEREKKKKKGPLRISSTDTHGTAAAGSHGETCSPLSPTATERRVKWNKPLAKVVIDSCCPLAARTRTAPGFHYFPLVLLARRSPLPALPPPPRRRPSVLCLGCFQRKKNRRPVANFRWPKSNGFFFSFSFLLIDGQIHVSS